MALSKLNTNEGGLSEQPLGQFNYTNPERGISDFIISENREPVNRIITYKLNPERIEEIGMLVTFCNYLAQTEAKLPYELVIAHYLSRSSESISVEFSPVSSLQPLFKLKVMIFPTEPKTKEEAAEVAQVNGTVRTLQQQMADCFSITDLESMQVLWNKLSPYFGIDQFDRIVISDITSALDLQQSSESITREA